MAELTYGSEGRVVSCLQNWLDRYWRRGKVSAKAKAALCNKLLVVLTAVRNECDPELLRLTDALYDRLEDIRHVRSCCTQRFMNALVKYVGETNAALRKSNVDCPSLTIPLRGDDETKTTVRIPDEYAKTDRTLVSACDVTPVEIDTKGLGETTVRIVILDGKVTCDITQKRK